MQEKICCVFNIAAHYRESIYLLMDKELNCEFYLGDRLPYRIELMDYEKLNGFKKILPYKSILGKYYWQKGAIALSFKSYRHYIITGEPYCISTWILLFINRLKGSKTYLWTHGWYGRETRLKRLVKKLFFGMSDKLLLYGDYARNIMIQEGFTPAKLLVIYNSLNYDKQLEIRKSLTKTSIYKDHFLNDYPVLLYVGRIQRRKKIDMLIETLNQLLKRKIYCNLILIGEEVDHLDIQGLIDSYDLAEYVWSYGPCYDENILGELIYNADVTVSPGDIGLTAIHSLMYGTPIITHNNFVKQMPEFEAITFGKSGDYFSQDSIDDLITKIINWINLTAIEREIIREKCYQIIDEKYNPHYQISVLRQLVNSK